MSASLASLIAVAIAALVHGATLALPPPLHALAHSLARVRSYREVQIGTSENKQGSGTIRTETIVVRAGHDVRAYVTTAATLAGKTLRSEAVYTHQRTCMRQGARGPWQCHAALAGEAPGSGTNGSLVSLGSDYSWTAAGTSTWRGAPSLRYRIASNSGAQMQVTGTLLIGRTSHLPQRYDGRVRYTGGSGATTLGESVTWSNWNDPTLQIPSP